MRAACPKDYIPVIRHAVKLPLLFRGTFHHKAGACAFAQAPPAPAADGKPATCAGRGGFLPAPATYQSVEQLPDGRVTFRICAPEAMSVRLNRNDIASVIPMAFGGGTANFRTLNAPASRAMAGLSMGGAHTLNNGLTHPELFGYVGVFSMGLMNPELVADYESKHAAALKEAAKRTKLVYYAMGKTDFREWINWRRYLEDFAPRLFK